MLYRNSMDLLNWIHTVTVDYQYEEIANYWNKNAILISEKKCEAFKTDNFERSCYHFKIICQDVHFW
jgi:hypothetical protein